jgi:hypothetical protein
VNIKSIERISMLKTRNIPYCNCISLYELTHKKKYTAKKWEGGTLTYLPTEVKDDLCIYCGYYASFGNPMEILDKLEQKENQVSSGLDIPEKDLNELFYGFYF